MHGSNQTSLILCLMLSQVSYNFYCLRRKLRVVAKAGLGNLNCYSSHFEDHFHLTDTHYRLQQT